MWDKIVNGLAMFSSAVLIGRDADGYPFSLRCHPQLDSAHQLLRLSLPAEINLQEGLAVLLCHSHDEKMWTLKNFNVRGYLAREGDAWIFRPQQFIPGIGMQGPLDQISTLRKTRAVAQAYLKKRSLSRPKIQWDEIKQLWNELGK